MTNIVYTRQACDEDDCMTLEEANKIKNFRQEVLDFLVGLELDPEGVEHAEREWMIDEIENMYDPDQWVQTHEELH